MSLTTARLLFVQSGLGGHGGAHGVCAWILEALRQSHDVTILTWQQPDLGRMNATYGTSLRPEQFRWVFPGWAARFLVDRIPDKSAFQRLNWLSAMAKGMANEFDLALSADDEIDFGRPGIQYVHYPHLAKKRNLAGIQPWRLISRFSFPNMLRNLTLVNSHWTAAQFQEAYGSTPTVLYPPASGEFPQVPWSARRDEFVCLSRLEPDKNHRRMIEILRRVRRHHPQIRFRIVGSKESSSARGLAYFSELRYIVDAEPDWLSLHVSVPRAELAGILSHARYGLHVRPGEHFGMGVAEMLRAGLIPFCHNSGGQVEIAARPELIFDSDDDAVGVIARLLEDPMRIAQTQNALQPARERFAPEHFCASLLATVNSFLHDRRARTAA